MASIYLWNSIANRRRSISDTFYDNGLASLKSSIEENGHRVFIADFANNHYYHEFSPRWLVICLRSIYKVIFTSRSSLVKMILQSIAFFLQKVLLIAQKRYLNKMLNEMLEEMQLRSIMILGIKVWYGDAFINANNLAKSAKKKIPGIIVVAGGYHVTLYENQLIKESNFDFGVAGPGAPAINCMLDVADKYKYDWNRGAVMNEFISAATTGKFGTIFYRTDDEIKKIVPASLPEIKYPIPKYDINPNKVKVHVIVESSGCPWGKCHFCVHNFFNKDNHQRNLDDLITEIRIMRHQGIGLFRFAGSDTPPYFGASIAQRLLKEDLPIIYSMGSRAVKYAKDRYIELVNNYSVMLKSGLRAIFVGGECGNNRINKEVMNKGITSEDIEYSIKAFREAERRTGIKAYMLLALIYPPPLIDGITLSEVEADNIDLLQRTMPDSVMISPPAPFIHSRWYTERDRFGFELGANYVSEIMKYEYVLYKPPKMWPKLDINLNNKPFVKILEECSIFRNKVQNELKIPTDVADEHILMFLAAGITKPEQIIEARIETMLDIISCDYTYTAELSEKVNKYSSSVAREQGISN